MSYKAIIADDEPKIIQLIRLLGKWETYDIEIVDECHDGRAALESIKKHSPDLVLSDIKMPDFDGLELIRQTRDAGINSLFILLSGYRHFEYARSAVALNVVDYLLKPIDEEQLNRTLARACMELEQSKENQENREELSKFRARKSHEIMEHFWRDFRLWEDPERKERMNASLRSVELCNAQYHTEFEKGCFQVVFMCSNIAGLLARKNFLLEDEMDGYTRKHFSDDAVIYYYVAGKGCIIVLNYPEEKKRKIRESISALYYSLRDLSEVYGELFLSFGVSSVKMKIQELKDAYYEAQAAEWGRLLLMRSGVLEYSQISGLPHVEVEELLPPEELTDIICCVKYCRREELGAAFQKLSERVAHLGNVYPGSLAETFFAIEDAVRRHIIIEKNIELMEDFDRCYVDARNYSQLMKNTFHVLDSYVERELKNSREKARKPIAEAVYFIRRHYAEPISEEDVARASNVSVTYLSRLFREELNIGFNEYLTQIRLEESEKLLADTTMSIKEIAAAVGYADEKYYSKLFKRTTGIKPTEYRKIYG